MTDTSAFYQKYQDIISARENGMLRDWVLTYLRNEGNEGLVAALERHHADYIELLEVPLSILKKIEGPEAPADRENVHVWDDRVGNLAQELEKGFVPPPLIVTDFWRPLEIADGNHRHEALTKNGVEKYWTIFFIQNEENKQLLSEYHHDDK